MKMRALLLTGVSAGAILIGIGQASAADIIRPIQVAPVAANNWDGHYWGGIAAVHRSYSFCYQISAGCGTSTYDASDATWQIGLAAGAGAEWMMNSRMSLKLEYLYVALPTAQVFSDNATINSYTPYDFTS